MLLTLSRACSYIAALILSVVINPVPPICTNDFQFFQAFIYRETPNLSAFSLQPSRVVYAQEFWPVGAARTNPNITYINTVLIPRLRNERRTAFIIDIEHWGLADISKLQQVVDALRRGLPGIKLGFYGVFPERQYWVFNRNLAGEMAAYQQRNAQWKPLAAKVDFVVPSLYTFYTDRAGWVRYANGMIDAARIYGKPVYPFIWPQYHDSNATLRWTYIEADFWTLQLQTVYGRADGFDLWGGLDQSGNVGSWSIASAAPWWNATVYFMRNTAGSKTMPGWLRRLWIRCVELWPLTG